MLKLVFIIISVFMAGTHVWAACSSPSGTAGQLQWISVDNTVKFCNGTNWIEAAQMKKTSCSSSSIGAINYSSGDLRFCNGYNWISMKGPSLVSCGGTTAGTFKYDTGSSKMRICDGTNWYDMTRPDTVFTRVQYAHNEGYPIASATFSSPPTEGNLLVAVSYYRADQGDPSISGTGWQLRMNRYSKTGSSDVQGMTIWTKVAGASEPSNIQTNYDTTVSVRLLIQEFSAGAWADWTVLDVVSNDSGTGSTSPLDSGNSASVEAGDLLLVGVGGWRNQSSNALTDIGFTNSISSIVSTIGGSNGRSIASGFAHHTTGGTKSTSLSWTGSGHEAMVSLLVVRARPPRPPSSTIFLAHMDGVHETPVFVEETGRPVTMAPKHMPIDTANMINDGGYAWLTVGQDFGVLGDNSSYYTRSPLEIFENGVPLGPPHATHADIRNTGLGLFSMWFDDLRMSASDNTNPKTNGRSYTYASNALINTSTKKFGTGSAYFNGDGGGFTVPNHSDFNLGAVDFTIELWVRFATAPSALNGSGDAARYFIDYGAVKGCNCNRGWGVGATTNKFFFASSYDGITPVVMASPITISTGTWYHVAYTREGNTLRMFVNGTLIGTHTLSGALSDLNTNPLTIGSAESDGWSPHAYIDEVRIVRGEALYTTAFTLPTEPFLNP